MEIMEIAKTIKENGGNLYLVGGAVRDKYLGIEPKDKDYCVTGLTDKEFEKIFPKAIKTGKSFPVYHINDSEFAIARKEMKTGDKHTDFNVCTDKTITIQDDLQRRDVTINSMAIDVITEELIDPFGGMKDLENKVIRATGKAFMQDALRVYRVAVLAARYNFKIDDNTIDMMKELKSTLKYLSGERVLEELKKALKCEKPSIFFQTLKEINCLNIHFKEIYDLIGVEQPIQYHPEGDAFNHTMEVVDRVALETDDIKIRFVALLHDLGKARTPKKKWPHHYNHEQLGVDCINRFCNKLAVSNDWRKSAITGSKEHMLGGKFKELKAGTKVDFIQRVHKSSLGLEALEIIVNADKHPQEKIEFAQLGKEIMENINGKEMTNITDYNILKDKVRQKRIRYLNEKLEISGV